MMPGSWQASLILRTSSSTSMSWQSYGCAPSTRMRKGGSMGDERLRRGIIRVIKRPHESYGLPRSARGCKPKGPLIAAGKLEGIPRQVVVGAQTHAQPHLLRGCPLVGMDQLGVCFPPGRGHRKGVSRPLAGSGLSDRPMIPRKLLPPAARRANRLILRQTCDSRAIAVEAQRHQLCVMCVRVEPVGGSGGVQFTKKMVRHCFALPLRRKANRVPTCPTRQSQCRTQDTA